MSSLEEFALGLLRADSNISEFSHTQFSLSRSTGIAEVEGKLSGGPGSSPPARSPCSASSHLGTYKQELVLHWGIMLATLQPNFNSYFKNLGLLGQHIELLIAMPAAHTECWLESELHGLCSNSLLLELAGISWLRHLCVCRSPGGPGQHAWHWSWPHSVCCRHLRHQRIEESFSPFPLSFLSFCYSFK